MKKLWIILTLLTIATLTLVGYFYSCIDHPTVLFGRTVLGYPEMYLSLASSWILLLATFLVLWKESETIISNITFDRDLIQKTRDTEMAFVKRLAAYIEDNIISKEFKPEWFCTEIDKPLIAHFESLEKTILELTKESGSLRVATKAQSEALQSKDAKIEELQKAVAEKENEIISFQPLVSGQSLLMDYCLKNKLRCVGDQSVGQVLFTHLESQQGIIHNLRQDITRLTIKPIQKNRANATILAVGKVKEQQNSQICSPKTKSSKPKSKLKKAKS